MLRKIKKSCASRDLREYIEAEIEVMLAEVIRVCPVESPGFNAEAIDWIEKNAAKFRKKWEQCRNSGKNYAVNN
jgi:hypothetical protein